MKTELRITCPKCGWHGGPLCSRLTLCPECKSLIVNNFHRRGNGVILETEWLYLDYTVHSAAVWWKPWTWGAKRYERKEITISEI